MEKLDIRVYKCVIGGVNRRIVGRVKLEEINMGYYPIFTFLLEISKMK